LLSGSVIIHTLVSDISTRQEVDQVLLSVRNDKLLDDLNDAFGKCDVSSSDVSHETAAVDTKEALTVLDHKGTADKVTCNAEDHEGGGESKRDMLRVDKTHRDNSSGHNTRSVPTRNREDDAKEISYITPQPLEMNVIIEHDITTVRNLAEGYIPLMDLPIYSTASSSSSNENDEIDDGEPLVRSNYNNLIDKRNGADAILNSYNKNSNGEPIHLNNVKQM